jgi:hypothetical protein
MRHGASIALPICILAACAASSSAPRRLGGGDVDASPGPAVSVADASEAGPTAAAVTDASVEAAAPCAGVDGGAVDVFVRIEVKNKVRHAIYEVPSVDARGEIFPIEGPANCGTRILRAAQRMNVWCVFSPSAYDAALVLKDGNLEIDSLPQSGGIDGPVAGHHIATVRLGCGVHLVLHGATWRDPKWARFGSDCDSRCFDKHEPCVDPCWEKQSDEHAELTEKGQACVDACTTALNACMARCRH